MLVRLLRLEPVNTVPGSDGGGALPMRVYRCPPLTSPDAFLEAAADLVPVTAEELDGSDAGSSHHSASSSTHSHAVTFVRVVDDIPVLLADAAAAMAAADAATAGSNGGASTTAVAEGGAADADGNEHIRLFQLDLSAPTGTRAVLLNVNSLADVARRCDEVIDSLANEVRHPGRSPLRLRRVDLTLCAPGPVVARGWGRWR